MKPAYKYRHIKTGAVLELSSALKGEEWTEIPSPTKKASETPKKAKESIRKAEK